MDKHLCPKCGTKQLYYMDTWVCPLCDYEAIEELKVAEIWKEIYEDENK